MRTPAEIHQATIDKLSQDLAQVFPVNAGNRQLEFVGLAPDSMPPPDDWNGQKTHVMENRTWSTPLRAILALKDQNGKILDRKTVRLGTLPTPTNRHTFIVDGREYQVAYQRRLKPGIYTKIDRTGAPGADFNLGKGRNFSLVLDPVVNRFSLRLGNTHVPLTSVLAGLRENQDPSTGLGKAFDTRALPSEVDRDLRTLYAETHLNKPVPDGSDALRGAMRDWFAQTTLSPDITHMTTGTSYTHVTDHALTTAARQVLEIHQGKLLPTNKDQLAYQEIYGIEDLLGERLRKNRSLLGLKIRRKLDRADTLGDLNLSASFHPLIHSFFTSSALSNNPTQVNPMEMRDGAHKITPMGDGGIGDANAIPVEVRNIHPSSAGFIDPVRTPDNSHAGVDVRTAVGVRKVGTTLQSQLIDRAGKRVWKSPADLFDRHVAHDNEPDWDGAVRAIHRGRLVLAHPEEIDYRIPTEDQFTPSTAMVPFIANSHAHRSGMGAKMLGQALSLVEREAPIVSTTHADVVAQDIVPRSPVAGTVVKLEPGVIQVQGSDGVIHRVNHPHEFPLNGGSYLHTDPGVKVGDTVKAGQVLGENNFTRAGKLALGKNLTVAYLPYKGHNYEDGIVVTEQGARKLTSQHLHTEEVQRDEKSVHDLVQFKSHFPGTFDRAQLDKLDTRGVARVGQVVHEGDPIVAMLRKRMTNPEQLILGKAHKALMQPYRDATLTWDKPYAGVVTAVNHGLNHIKVTLQSQAPAMVGDKICARYGNKGVITSILPDHEAPRTADGMIPDVMLNGAGLISRMNNGQIFEVAAAKALRKLGIKSQVFPQFSGANTHELITKLVDKAGVEPAEEMFDPSGRSIGKILIGPEYMLKLFKRAETGFSARSGGRYDIDLRPAKGGEEGAKSIGHLDLFGLLAHGSRDLLREKATHTAEYRPDVLQAMWRGAPLPPPEPTFAWRKFEAMLKGAGVNVHKNGSRLTLLPMTDKDTLSLSRGAVMRPLTVTVKDDPETRLPFRPEAGGLFDTAATGGLVGQRWSHISLVEPVLSPLFTRPARILLGLKQTELDELIRTEGGAGVAARLAKIDPMTRSAQLQSQLATSSGVQRDTIHKQLKYLKPLIEHDLKPQDAYVVRHVPVIPPAMRPIYPDADTGKITNSDANLLYQHLMLVNEQLAHHVKDGDPELASELRLGLQEALASVQGMDGKTGDHQPQGFLKLITGQRAKEGFFQDKLMSRRQDVAGRGVIIPNPSLGIDEIGLPEQMAWKLYRHHAVGELIRAGYPLDQAATHIADQSTFGKKALLSAMKDHPVIMTRAPSLHRFNLQAFKPQLTSGKAIEIPNLIVKGFNADFDGDAVNLHIPLSPEATRDAHRMLPSKNLLGVMDRSPVHALNQEVVMGLWGATHVPSDSKTARTFKTRAEALTAFGRGEIRISDPIELVN